MKHFSGIIYLAFYHTLVVLQLISYMYIKGTWSLHSFKGDYLSIPEGTSSCWYLFHEIPGR